MIVRPLVLFIVFAALMLSVRVIDIYERGTIILAEKTAFASDKTAVETHGGSGEEGRLENVVADKDSIEKPPVPSAAEGDRALVAALEEAAYGEYSDAELEILQSLGERRQQLDAREREMDRRIALIQAAEERLDKKTRELRGIEQEIKTARVEIEKLVQQYDTQKDAEFRSLIATYEKMKPAEAAQIMNHLDIDILLGIARGMKDSKMAPILAAMSPEKAKRLTVELARPRDLPGIIQKSQ